MCLGHIPNALLGAAGAGTLPPLGKVGEKLYLGKVRAEGFKSLLNVDVSLRQGVTVVVGRTTRVSRISSMRCGC